MTNKIHPPARDAGAWAKQILARASNRRRRTGLVQQGRQTRTRIHFLVACKLALITAAVMME
jgi:hypothetical protein